MTTYYTVIGLAPEPFTRMAGGRDYGLGQRDGVRSYSTLGQARAMRTRAGREFKRKGITGIDFKILRTIIYEDAEVSIEWVD